jgi:hypothetical protein
LRANGGPGPSAVLPAACPMQRPPPLAAPAPLQLPPIPPPNPKVEAIGSGSGKPSKKVTIADSGEIKEAS